MADGNVFPFSLEPLLAHLVAVVLRQNPVSAVRLRRACRQVDEVIRNRPELIAWNAWRINLVEARYVSGDDAYSELGQLWTQYALRMSASMVEQSRQMTNSLSREGLRPVISAVRRPGVGKYEYQEGAPDELYSGISDWEVTVPYSLDNFGLVFQPSREVVGFPYRNTYTSYFELTIKRDRHVGGSYPIIGFALSGLKRISSGGPPCSVLLTLTGQPYLYIANGSMHPVTSIPSINLGDVVGIGITKVPMEAFSSSWPYQTETAFTNCYGDFSYAVFITLNGKLMHSAISKVYPFQLSPFVNYHSAGGVDLVNISGSPSYPWTYNIYQHIDSFPFCPITDHQEGANKFKELFHPRFFQSILSQSILVPTFHPDNPSTTDSLLEDTYHETFQAQNDDLDSENQKFIDTAQAAPSNAGEASQIHTANAQKMDSSSKSKKTNLKSGEKAEKSKKQKMSSTGTSKTLSSSSSPKSSTTERPSWLWMFYLQHGIHPDPETSTVDLVEVFDELPNSNDSKDDSISEESEDIIHIDLSSGLGVSERRVGTGLEDISGISGITPLIPSIEPKDLLEKRGMPVKKSSKEKNDGSKIYEGCVLATIVNQNYFTSSPEYLHFKSLKEGETEQPLSDDVRANLAILCCENRDVYFSTFVHTQFLYRELMCTFEGSYTLMHHNYGFAPAFEDPTFFPEYKIWDSGSKTTVIAISDMANRVAETPSLTHLELSTLLKRYGWMEAVPPMNEWPRGVSELAVMLNNSAGMTFLFMLFREIGLQLAKPKWTQSLWIPRELWMNSRIFTLLGPEYADILRELPPMDQPLQTIDVAYDRYRRLKMMGVPKVPWTLTPIVPFWRTLFPAITLMRGLHKWKYSLTTHDVPAFTESVLTKYGANHLKLRHFVVQTLLYLPFSIVPITEELSFSQTLQEALNGLYEARRIVRAQYPSIKAEIAQFCSLLAEHIDQETEKASSKRKATTQAAQTTNQASSSTSPFSELKTLPSHKQDVWDNTSPKDKASALLWLFGDVPEINDTFDIFLPTVPFGTRLSHWIYNFIWESDPLEAI